MANLRNLKKGIDYTLEEFVFDCDMAIFCQPAKVDAVFALMERSVALRNSLYQMANNIAEPKNPKLVKKHFASLRNTMEVGFSELFETLSTTVNPE